MKISSREDVEVPIDFVFTRASDFAHFEHLASQRGAKVSRTDSGEYRAGSSWDVSFRYRGRKRQLKAVVHDMRKPETLEISTDSSGISGQTVIELVALAPKRTRIIASIELRPKTMSARILIQSLKLAKSNLTNRFKSRLVGFGEDVTEDYRREHAI